MGDRRSAARWAAILLVLVAGGGLAGARTAHAATLDVTLRPTDGGGVAVTERWRLDDAATFARGLYLEGWVGWFPLRQRLAAIDVRSDAGPLAHERQTYGGDRVRLVFERPLPRELTVRYRWLGAVDPDTGRARLRLWFLDAPAVERLTVRAADGVASLAVSAPTPDYEQAMGAVREQDGALVTSGGPLDAEPAVDVDLVVSAPGCPAGGWSAEAGRQLALPAAALALVIALSLLALLLPPRWRAGALVAGLAAALLLTLRLMAPLAYFDVRAPQYAGLERVVNALSAVLVYAGLIGALAFVSWRLVATLRAARAEAWHMAFGAPVLFALLLWPATEVQPGLWLVPLIAAAPLLAWWTPRVRVWTGAERYRLAEEIRTEGAVGLDELARRFRLTRPRLAALLRNHPELPIAVDFEAGEALAPGVAALRRDLAVCPSCGGATRLTSASHAACAYCQRVLAHVEPVRPARPVPAVVEAVAALLDAVGLAVLVWTGLLAVVAFLDEWLQQGLGAAVGSVALLLVVGGGLGALALHGAAAFRAGRAWRAAQLLLLVLSPLVAPLVALLALRSRRVRLHFGRWDPRALDETLRHRGALSLPEVADMLGCSVAEAAETARFLAGDARIDAVYDRIGARLVARAAFRTLAREGSCRACGGLLGERDGEIRCQFCGERPAA